MKPVSPSKVGGGEMKTYAAANPKRSPEGTYCTRHVVTCTCTYMTCCYMYMTCCYVCIHDMLLHDMYCIVVVCRNGAHETS